MSYTQALAALQGVVNTYATAESLPVVWDNTERKPTHAEAFLACSFLPGKASGVTLGPDGADEKPGIYQISVHVHRGWGVGAALDHADALVAAFKRQRLTVGGTTVHAFRAWPGPGFEDGDRYVVPVSVQWTVYE